MNSITIGLNLPNEVKKRSVRKKLSKLSQFVCFAICSTSLLLSKFRPRQFSIKLMAEREKKKRKKTALKPQV